MQHVKQLAGAAMLMALTAVCVAHADDPGKHPGGRDAEPAIRTGSAAHEPQHPADAQRSWAALNRSQVEELQRELASRGSYRGAVDGIAGPQTRAALQQFQQQQGLDPGRGLDEPTRKALGLQLDKQPVSGVQTSAGPELGPESSSDIEHAVGREPSPSGGAGAPTTLKLDTLDAAQLSTLQTRLGELGFYRGTVDGVWGSGTRSALERFFRAQAELASRGVLTHDGAQMLGVTGRGSPPSTDDMGGPGNSAPATMPHPQPSTP